MVTATKHGKATLEQPVLRQDPALDRHEPGERPGGEGPGPATGAILGTVTAVLPVADVGGRPARPLKPSTNMPLPLSRFIGRDERLAAVQKLRVDDRMVTLTGLGSSRTVCGWWTSLLSETEVERKGVRITAYGAVSHANNLLWRR
jgi:hypothetical protein